MGKLDGKVAIVTGAGSGLGRAIAILFTQEGAKVVVADLDSQGGEETVSMVRAVNGEAMYVHTNVTKAEDIQRAVTTTVEKYGRLQIMVNNAGINPKEGAITECPEKTFDDVIAVNLKGVWLGMKYAIPAIIKAGGGSIINMASLAAFKSPPSISAYAASKGGVKAMSQAVAVGFAPQNVRVNCVAPGSTITPLLLGQWNEDELRTWTKLTPLGKLGTMEEVAKLALFLASDDSSHIVGQTILMDGGMAADLHVGR